MKEKIPIIVILGPTATGKSDLAVAVAKWIEENKIGGFKGAEIISADSRQVYIGLDIGTGKITKEEMKGVPHHCLDIAKPEKRFTVMDWKACAQKAIQEIHVKNKLPIICGGTGFYIDTLINDMDYPDIDIDNERLEELESVDTNALFKILSKIDSVRASKIDKDNKRRLIRSILIAEKLGKVPELNNDKEQDSPYKCIKIGLQIPDEKLKDRIKTRLIKRMDAGMLDEAKKLHSNGLSLERMRELGLEYRYLADLIENKISYDKFIEVLNTKIWQYARRQKTWFKRDKEIKWYDPADITLDLIRKML
jgi:tRNA dimethylallyltransferase